MTKHELIERVASKLGNERATPQAKQQVRDELHKKTVALVIDTVFAELGEYFIKAKLTNHRKAARPLRDFCTGRTVVLRPGPCFAGMRGCGAEETMPCRNQLLATHVPPLPDRQ